LLKLRQGENSGQINARWPNLLLARDKRRDPPAGVGSSFRADLAFWQLTGSKGMNSITHFEIYGAQPERLAEFYRGVFGWRIEQMAGVDFWTVAKSMTLSA
jgi:hypothetical protein